MKTNVTKKAVALMLAIALAVTAGACSKGGSTGTQSGSTSTTTPTRTDDPSKEVTLTAFVMQSSASVSGVQTDWIAKQMQKDLNVKIDFYPTGQDVDQKIQTYLAGGELPDIIGFKGMEAANNAMNANMLAPLNDYKDLMPVIFDNKMYDDAVRYYEKYGSNDTGNLYIMPTGIGPSGSTETNWVPEMQWGLYKQIGSPAVNTLEDYLTVAKKMQEAKPTTDAGEKVYGFTLFSSWDKISASQISTLSFFYGIDTEYVSSLMETNLQTRKTTSLLADDSFYKRALKFYYTANQMGLLDPDSLTQTYENATTKYTNGRSLFTYFSWLTGDYNTPKAGHVTNTANPDGYAPVVAKDFKIYNAPDATIGKQWFFAMSSNCQNKERAAKTINWLYDIKNQELIANGPEGTLWSKDSSGEPKVTDAGWDIIDNKKEMPLEGGGTLTQPGTMWNSLGFTGGAIDPATKYTITYRYWPSTITRNPTAMKQDVNKYYGTNTLIDYLTKNNMLTNSTQAVNMVATPSDDLKLKISQIGEVVKTNSWKMVFAKNDAEFESLYKDMQTQAKGLGMDDVVSFYTKAWADALDKVKDYE